MIRPSVAIRSLLILAVACLVAPARARDARPPDVAPALLDAVAGTELRDEHIGLMRGLPASRSGDLRVRAIDEMNAHLARLGPFTLGSGWTPIGPAPIPNGQTIGVSTPVSGRVTAIAIHPSNPDIVYAGTAGGGVYRTLNGGAAWTPIFDDAASLAIGALALAPSDPTILYVGTGAADLSADSFFGVGLYRIDGADSAPILTGPIDPPVATGTPGTTAFTGRSISRILVHPTNPATIFVSTVSGVGGMGVNPLATTVPPLAFRGIYRSTDGTSASPSFTRLAVTTEGDGSGNVNVNDMVLEPGNPNVLVCWLYGGSGVAPGVFRTANALAATPTFTRRHTALDVTARGAFAVSRDPLTLTVNHILASGENTNGRLRRSTDGGVTWSGFLTGGQGFCGSACFYALAVATRTTDASLILLGGGPAGAGSFTYRRSNDGGATFPGGNDLGLHPYPHALTIAPSNANVVYQGSDGGIYKSTNAGQTWTSLSNADFSATLFQSVAVHPTDPVFTLAGSQGNGTNLRRPDGTWTRADGGDAGYALIDRNATDVTNVRMYHTYFNQGSLMGFARVTSTASATDGGWTFLGCGFGTPNGITCGASSTVLFYAPMALGPGNPSTLYFGSNVLYRSIDGGTTMIKVSQEPLVAGQPISAIGVSPTDDNVRLVGLRNGRLFATTTGVLTLTDVTNAGMPANFVGRAVIDPNNANTAYVTFCGFGVPAGQHVWKTTNLAGGGGAWVAAGAGIPDVPVNAFVVDPANSSHLYAGTEIGVYRSLDGGASWAPFVTGLPRAPVFDLAIQGTSHVLRAATHGRGMWEIDLDATTAVPVVAAELVDGEVRLTWHFDEPSGVARLERRPVPGDWSALGELSADGAGTMSYRDRHVAPGRRYEYRLAFGAAGSERYTGHVWVDVPGGDLALRGVWPNPARRSLTASLALAGTTGARLDLVDLHGRRVHSRDLSGLGPGRHDVRIDVQGLAAGAYWVRLEQGGRVLSRRASVVR